MKTYTAGMFKTFLECPEKYNLMYNEHVEIPSDNRNAVIGQKLHALINYKLRGLDISKMLQSLDLPENEELKVLWHNFSANKIDSVIESELTFNVKLNDFAKITGRVDAIKQTGAKIEILDWKTGSSKNINYESEMQTIVYLVSIYKMFSYLGQLDNPENLSMTYYFLKENISKTIKFSKEKNIEFEMKLEKLTKKISLEKPNIKGTKANCQKCRYKIVCGRAYGGL